MLRVMLPYYFVNGHVNYVAMVSDKLDSLRFGFLVHVGEMSWFVFVVIGNKTEQTGVVV